MELFQPSQLSSIDWTPSFSPCNCSSFSQMFHTFGTELEHHMQQEQQQILHQYQHKHQQLTQARASGSSQAASGQPTSGSQAAIGWSGPVSGSAPQVAPSRSSSAHVPSAALAGAAAKPRPQDNKPAHRMLSLATLARAVGWSAREGGAAIRPRESPVGAKTRRSSLLQAGKNEIAAANPTTES